MSSGDHAATNGLHSNRVPRSRARRRWLRLVRNCRNRHGLNGLWRRGGPPVTSAAVLESWLSREEGDGAGGIFEREGKVLECDGCGRFFLSASSYDMHSDCGDDSDDTLELSSDDDGDGGQERHPGKPCPKSRKAAERARAEAKANPVSTNPSAAAPPPVSNNPAARRSSRRHSKRRRNPSKSSSSKSSRVTVAGARWFVCEMDCGFAFATAREKDSHRCPRARRLAAAPPDPDPSFAAPEAANIAIGAGLAGMDIGESVKTRVRRSRIGGGSLKHLF